MSGGWRVQSNTLFFVKEGKTLFLSDEGLSENYMPPKPVKMQCSTPRYNNDGSCFSYVAREAPFGESSAETKTLLIVRVSDRKVIKRIQLKAGMQVRVEFDNRSPFIYLLYSYPGTHRLQFDIYDPRTEHTWSDLKASYTNVTGDVTAMIDQDGLLHYYLHEGNHSVGPVETRHLEVFYAEGKKYFTVDGDYFEFPESGKQPQKVKPPHRGWYEMIYWNQGQNNYYLNVGVKYSHGMFGSSSFLYQELKPPHERIDVVHPRFPLFRSPDKGPGIVYADLASDELFHPRGRIVAFDSNQRMVKVIDEDNRFYLLEPESKNNSTVHLGHVKAQGAFVGNNPQFVVMYYERDGNDDYSFHDLRTKKLNSTLDRLMKVVRKKNELDTKISSLKYTRVGFDGKYFVFIDPINGDAVYLNPDSPQSPVFVSASSESVPAKDPDVDLRSLWETRIIERRDRFIQQIRAGFGPVVDLVPSAFRDYITTELQRIISDYYGLQEKELRGRFRDAMAGAPFEEEERLPFDRIENRLTSAMDELRRLLETFHDIVTSQPFRVQKEFYANLFKGLLSTASRADLNTNPSNPFLDSASLKAMALGWRVGSPASWDALPIVSRFLSDLQGAVRGGVPLETTQQMLGYLSELAARAPPHEAQVFSRQLEKLLNATPAAKRAYLQRFYSAFQNTTPSQWQGFLNGVGDTSSLGDMRPWVEYLTHEIDPVREKKRWVPEGEYIPMPSRGVEISQIIGEEVRRPKKNKDDKVMSIEYLIDHINDLPGANGSLEQEILRNVTVQGESGAYTREIAQNSIDATQGHRGTLEVDFYLQKGADGADEFVEEARDNGTGALNEVALLIPLSTKAEGAQSESVGFFGTGKYTLLEDVDRLEIITKNRGRSFMFTLEVKKGENGRPVGVALIGIRKLNDTRLPEGVSVRRIKSIQNTIPGLDQRLAQLAWKTFAGLSQSETFKIEMIDSDGKRRPLEVDAPLMTEAAFTTARRGETTPTTFGHFRIYRSKGLSSQVVDRKGLRIGPIKDEYLALIPDHLRKHVKELGLIIQIPLPLIRSRTGFEDEAYYLPTIQKYVALEFYKTLARLAMTDARPAFSFEGLASDWEMNADYWRLFGEQEQAIIGISEAANNGRYDLISTESLEVILPKEQSRTNPDRRYMKLLVLLNVLREPSDPDSGTSLFLRRLAVLQKVDVRLAAREMTRLRGLGLSVGRIPQPNEIPGWAGYVSGARFLQDVRHQRVEELIISPNKYSPEERRLISRAKRVAELLGLERVYLAKKELHASGLFTTVQDPETGMPHRSVVLNQSILHRQPAYGEAIIDSAADTVTHELAHFLEHLIEEGEWFDVSGDTYRTHPIEQTHESVGPFAESMKYVSALWLAKGGAISFVATSGPSPGSGIRTGEKPPSSANSLAYLLTGNPWLGMVWVILVEIPILLMGNMPFLLPVFALAHVAIEFLNNPRLSLTQLAKSFLKHLLMASPYLLVAGVPGFDWETLFAVVTHVVYDVQAIYTDRRDARKYADFVAETVMEDGSFLTAEDLVPFEGSLQVESIGGKVLAIHNLLGPKIRQPGFRLAFEQSLKKTLNNSNGKVLPGFDLVLKRLLSSVTGKESDRSSRTVVWLVVDQDDIPSLNHTVSVLAQQAKAGELKTRLIISPARESMGDQLTNLYGTLPFADVLRDPITDEKMSLQPKRLNNVYLNWKKENPSFAETLFTLSIVVSRSVYVEEKAIQEAGRNADLDISLKDALTALLNQRIQPIDFESLIRVAQMVVEFA